jgi:hypothetical protein
MSAKALMQGNHKRHMHHSAQLMPQITILHRQLEVIVRQMRSDARQPQAPASAGVQSRYVVHIHDIQIVPIP